MLAAGTISAPALLELYLERISRVDRELRSYRVVMAASARREAATAQERLDAGERLPLLGVPVAIKDDVDVAGEFTCFGSSAYDQAATADGEVVRRLREAGAVILGKTAVPEMMLWPFTETLAFGSTHNPWDLAYTPGGSSGGSGAAVAAGLAPLALGSDGAGSIRIPASWCGLYGLKPQRDRVPIGPHEDPWCGLSVNGPLCRTVEDAALFRSDDGGMTWNELPGLREHDTAGIWQPGAGGLCLHTIILDPTDPNRIYIAISAAGAFRTDDGGQTWKPINHGLKSDYIPEEAAEVGHCVHHVAMHPSRPGVLFMQKHWDVMRSDDGGDNWHEVSDNLPSDFGFVIDIHAHEPETIYVVPIKSDSEHYPPDGKLRVYRSRSGGNGWEALTNGLPQQDCYVNVLRDAMAVDRLDSCGIYFGTTGGQVYASADSGDNWAAIVRDLPAVLSVEVQTLP